jgi:hypothetical protein
MGLTIWTGTAPRKTDVAIAKNYLDADELDALNKIVTAYLEFAEVQALNRRPMYMADWITKLDDFLKLSERHVLSHAGRVSHETAVSKAELEYDRFAAARATLAGPVDKDFDQAIRDVKQIERARRTTTAKKPSPKGKGKP